MAPEDLVAASPSTQPTVSPVVAIRKFFFAANANMMDVATEIKALTPEDKAELAEGAARELGLTLKV